MIKSGIAEGQLIFDTLFIDSLKDVTFDTVRVAAKSDILADVSSLNSFVLPLQINMSMPVEIERSGIVGDRALANNTIKVGQFPETAITTSASATSLGLNLNEKVAKVKTFSETNSFTIYI